MPVNVHSPQIRIADLAIDLNQLTINVGTAEHPIRRKEAQLLRILQNYPNQVINKYALQELVWDFQVINPSNTLEVHLSSLRRKVHHLSKKVRIETIRGVGYRLSY